ncbi:diuretic hormone 44 isoform X2 [Cataglyphis hispanica]|uniref:diuretic hormone 44 isoform X2 n=1 Tax=Cataglyphis hispanica TaxID=1086592 RepID=UPI0021807AA2|nr:diuretic hormone 44 isoform X2 [Cataglyphis hispanica]
MTQRSSAKVNRSVQPNRVDLRMLCVDEWQTMILNCGWIERDFHEEMNVVNLHSSCTMILLGILASTTIIGLTSSAPLSSYERRDMSDDGPKIFLLMDERVPELEEILGNELGSDVTRVKRIGSLSIVNNLDVLRQRVLLELARRKQEQDLRQIQENRRVLENIGKRSVPGSDAGRIARSGKSRNDHRDRPAVSNRIEWIEEDDPLFRGSQDGRMARVQANELRLL